MNGLGQEQVSKQIILKFNIKSLNPILQTIIEAKHKPKMTTVSLKTSSLGMNYSTSFMFYTPENNRNMQNLGCRRF